MRYGEDVLTAVLSRLPVVSPDAVRLICIEGLGGAGKSTLSRELAMRSGDIIVVHGDDFYGPEERDWRSWTPEQGYRRYFDHQRLERELLRPLQAGRVGRIQRYDWETNALGDWVTVEPQGVVLVEGVYLLRPELRGYWDFSVYVETPRSLRQERLYARGERGPGWIARWAAAEDYYEQVEQPAAVADLVISGY